MTAHDPDVLQRLRVTAGQEAPVDMQALQKVLGDNVEMQLSILQKFAVQTGEILASTLSAHEQHNADEVRFLAHKLKSSASTVGANRLSDICCELEVAGRNADWANIDPLVGAMQSEASRVSDYIDAL
jgi:HPt (histidine-containing phosphotransfer) domain-containing protein